MIPFEASDDKVIRPGDLVTISLPPFEKLNHVEILDDYGIVAVADRHQDKLVCQTTLVFFLYSTNKGCCEWFPTRYCKKIGTVPTEYLLTHEEHMIRCTGLQRSSQIQVEG